MSSHFRTIFKRSFVIFIIVVLFSTATAAWNLSTLGLRAGDYKIEHVSVFYVRAFLCLSAAGGGNKSQSIVPTLVEVPWPEPPQPAQLIGFGVVNIVAAAPTTARIYPTDLDHAGLNARKCNGIIAARATAVDMRGGDLWLLDGGSEFCAPKLIEYDLVVGAGRDEETHRQELGGLKGRRVASVHVVPSDVKAAANSSSSERLIVTLADADADFLVVYAVGERWWWKLKLITSHNRIVVPHTVAFRQSGQLYIADRSDHLWLMPKLRTGVLQNRTAKHLTVQQVPVRFVADLLGASGSCLVVDAANRLYYDLPRDGAVVRWNTKRALRAESHDVLHFGRRRLAQIVFGYQGAVWVVAQQASSGRGSHEQHCERVLAHFTDGPTQRQSLVAASRRKVHKRQVDVTNKWPGFQVFPISTKTLYGC